MKVGIGITTFQRPGHLNNLLHQISETCRGCEVYTADDTVGGRKGIAFRKNECLWHLKDCDYIFLFDDDCFPIKEGWMDFFIQQCLASKQHHFLYLKETPTIKRIGGFEHSVAPYNIKVYDNCGGCFMFLTQEVIQKVGGYGEYGLYGFEHAGYTERIYMAGLTPMGKYLCPEGAGEYIYAMDYDFHLPFNKKLNHRSSLINEADKLDMYLASNYKQFTEDVKTIHRPLLLFLY